MDTNRHRPKAHTWKVVAKNSYGSTASSLWSFEYDATPPTAVYGGQAPALGESTFDFTVVYSDTLSGVNASTLGSMNIIVKGPNAYTQRDIYQRQSRRR